MKYAFATVDVFTDARFGGNPLAVFPHAEGLDEATMQALAREFNYAETTFVLPPADPDNTARVRIFTPAAEMPFAGHPNVGTAYVLAMLAEQAGAIPPPVLRFEELAGLVPVELLRGDGGRLTGARLTAPQTLTTGAAIEVALVAACAGLDPADIVTAAHPPLSASVGAAFVIAEVSPDALTRARPLGGADMAFALHLYAQGAPIRARMFAPGLGVTEDPATGSANAALGGLLAQLSGADQAFDVVQGVEMGRPSRLRVTTAGGVVQVAGGCVPVLTGSFAM